MAIHEVTQEEALQRCARCGSDNRLSLKSLEVGVARDGHVDADILPLPPCTQCRSTEFLIRSGEEEGAHLAPGSFGHLHRLLVNHLHAELVQRGRVIPAPRAKALAGTVLPRPVPRGVLARWFPKGLRIEAPHVEKTPNPGAPSE
ncbi:hypothetical protein JQX13_46925 [Archangium violaceum]|uniref:hypothetical protein n=1 Tax=Archangium violaceum TaxID=83451 RepID=UPI00193B4549|nr:hypothetical protein [Archangium violaceum]QRK07468.1 hypothetical protein JQX13_46925 [Archangium violaceum]